MRSLSAIPSAGLLAITLLLAGIGTAACSNGGQDAASKDASKDGEAQKVAAADGAEKSKSKKAGKKKPYKVKCPDDGACKVGEKTYIGWRTFSGFCERCHGPGGLGSSIGPNLIERIPRKPINKSRFIQVVSAGWDGPMSGQMPAFGQNPNVNDKLDELWAYLQARVDGKIGPGRPDKIGAKGPGEGAPANWE